MVWGENPASAGFSFGPKTMIKRFGVNRFGRDFVVGDIHGQFTLLQSALDQIGFDTGVDRLFSVGDLVDRGPESEDCTEWLARSWFHAIRGNHEQMAIDARVGYVNRSVYVANGGAWFLAMPREHQTFYTDAFEALPILIEIEVQHPTWPTPQLVGLVHAGCPMNSWDELKAELIKQSEIAGRLGNYVEMNCLWSRTRIESGEHRAVSGVHKVISGHTPTDDVVELGNSLFIDTIGWRPSVPTAAFTFVELPTWQIHTVSTHAGRQPATMESHDHAA